MENLKWKTQRNSVILKYKPKIFLAKQKKLGDK